MTYIIGVRRFEKVAVLIMVLFPLVLLAEILKQNK